MTAAAPTVAAARPLARPAWLGSFAVRVAAGIALLALWEGLVTWLLPSYVARPSGVVRALPNVLSDRTTISTQLTGLFWPDVWDTLSAVLEGLAIGVVTGVLVGLAMGRLRDLESALKFYVSAFFAMPVVAILPLMTLWFGYTGRARLAVIVLGSFLPVALNVYDGVRKLPTTYIEVAKTYHARWWNVWFGIALPASMPYLLAGIRLAAGRALLAAVAAEYLLALRGLGYFIRFGVSSYHQNEATVAVLTLGLIGIAINGAVNLATRRLFPWYRPA